MPLNCRCDVRAITAQLLPQLARGRSGSSPDSYAEWPIVPGLPTVKRELGFEGENHRQVLAEEAIISRLAGA